MNQNKGNQNNIIAKIKHKLSKQDSANCRKNEKEEEPELLGYFVGVLPTMTGHPDTHLED